MMTPTWINDVTFNTDGLIPAIAQDNATGEILMMAWMNAEALTLTANTKKAVYFSRSRGKLWHKGETSGHTQMVHDIFLDCDADVILLKVTQIGDVACHTGRRSCFYRRLNFSNSPDKTQVDNNPQPTWEVVAPVIKDPNEIYGANKHSDRVSAPNGDAQPSTPPLSNGNQAPTLSATTNQHDCINAADILSKLDDVLIQRKTADADGSYVASLYAKGLNKILEKVGEEVVEAIIAAKDLAGTDDKNKQALHDDLIYEIADVWFHTMVTLAWFNIDSQQILNELARRFGLSGIDEKNSRLS